MSQKESLQTGPSQQHGPPMPKGLFKVVNRLMKLLLKSPLHGWMSNRLMVLSYTGRKTGKHFSTPVGYVQDGDCVFVFTHSAWRANFMEPAPVKMRIRGKELEGTARLVSEPQRIKYMIRTLTLANGEALARQMGFWVENLESAGPEAVRQATRGTYFIEITVSGGK
jgi:hypothetical protein